MQPYRHKMDLHLPQAGGHAGGQRTSLARRPPSACPTTYERAEDFIADLRLIQDSLRGHRAGRLADGRLGSLVRQAEVFGFHLATLDIRQHAGRHTAALAEVFARYGLAADYAALPEAAEVALLTAELLEPAAVCAGPARLQRDDQRDAGASSA